jgi:quinol monooxygenase YgiN
MSSDPGRVPNFVVAVEFRLKPGSRDAFRQLIVENAQRSVADEEGCRQFDVVVPAADPDRIFLYEIYDTAEAFEVHKRAAHFLAFDVASAEHVLEKKVMLGTRVCP